MPDNEEIKNAELRALTTLITTNHEENKRTTKAFEKFVDLRFRGLETHNAKQNGSIGKAIDNIARLEKESQERKLTCMTAVKALKDNAAAAKENKKEERTQKLSRRQWVALFLVSAVMMSIAIGGFIISVINMNA